MRRLQRGSFLLMAIVILSCVLPIARRWLPYEIGLWKIAEAGNHFRDGKLDLASQSMDEAESWSKEVLTSADYSELMMNLLIEQGDSERALELIKVLKLQGNPSVAVQAGLRASHYFAAGQDYPRALQALQISTPPDTRLSPSFLNQIAYMKAMAGVDLDTALIEIDTALQFLPDASLLDTKAWILFQSQKYEDAARVAERAVEEFEKAAREKGVYVGEGDDSVAKLMEQPPTIEVPSELQQHRDRMKAVLAESQPRRRYEMVEQSAVQTAAVLRYHRANIYDALRQTDRSKKDWDWLECHHFQDESLLR
jgi:tetratricopeptide (TPR) repeat protein